MRRWNVDRHAGATATGVPVTVGHRPPGTRTWHTIDQRLVAHMRMHWRGQPLVSHAVIVDVISATTTRSGWQGQAELDTSSSPTKVTVSDADRAALHIPPHTFHGEWKYPLSPPSDPVNV